MSICVIGAGLSGLACAFDLARAEREVIVLEARERAGGFAGTDALDGFLFERGPTTVPASAASFRELATDAGLAERLIASSESARARWIFYRGKLRELPAGPGSLLTSSLLSWRAKAFAASEPMRRWSPPPEIASGAAEPSARGFIEERFGREPARLFAAVARGIYAGDLGALGARSAFPRMWQLAVEHGGVVRGLMARERELRRDHEPGSEDDQRDGTSSVERDRQQETEDDQLAAGSATSQLLSFPGGLQELVDALVLQLGSRLRTGARAKGIARAGATFRIDVEGGADVTAETVVLATPAPVAARLLAPLVPEHAAATLALVPHAGVALVHLGCDATALALPPGFGFLVPPDEVGAPSMLGAIFTSNLFPGRAPAGAVSVACFHSADEVLGLTPEESAERSSAELARALGLSRAPEPRAHRTIAWERAIPQYTVGHDLRMREVLAAVAALGRVHLAGNATHGIGVEQVIARGRDVARRILA